MAYDPVKALQAAGILEGPLPADLASALANLSQDDVDTIISHKSQLPPSPSQVAKPWITPDTAALAVTPALSCLCGVWSGSGAGPRAVE
jgi:hypothetical protein